MSKKQSGPFSEPTYKSDPYAFYAQIRTETPVHQAVLPNGVEVYLVTRYQDVLAGLKIDPIALIVPVKALPRHL